MSIPTFIPPKRSVILDIPYGLELLASEIRRGTIKAETCLVCLSGPMEDIDVYHYGIGTPRAVRAVAADALAFLQQNTLNRGPGDVNRQGEEEEE